MIYLDNAATTQIDEEVLDSMLPYLREQYGNPSSKYYSFSDSARNAVEEAREKVAQLIGATSEEIIFTSGSTESSNLIIKGVLDYSKYYGDGRNHVITSNAEHKATLNVCKYLNGDIYSNKDATVSLFATNKKVDRGYRASFISVDNNGVVNDDEFEKAITNQTALASFFYVNNEIGSVNDIEALADTAHRHHVSLHVDATQALGKIPINVRKSQIDFLSVSAHKIYGPKGVGCAYIHSNQYGLPPISALIHGGEQECGIRAGTLAVHNIVGFGKASEIALRDMKKNNEKTSELDAYLVSKLLGNSNLQIVIREQYRIKGIVSIHVKKRDFNNERFIKRLSDRFAISTGSACSMGEPSHVIAAIGMKSDVSKILRVSLSKYTSKEQIDEFVAYLNQYC